MCGNEFNSECEWPEDEDDAADARAREFAKSDKFCSELEQEGYKKGYLAGFNDCSKGAKPRFEPPVPGDAPSS